MNRVGRRHRLLSAAAAAASAATSDARLALQLVGSMVIVFGSEWRAAFLRRLRLSGDAIGPLSRLVALRERELRFGLRDVDRDEIVQRPEPDRSAGVFACQREIVERRPRQRLDHRLQMPREHLRVRETARPDPWPTAA